MEEFRKKRKFENLEDNKSVFRHVTSTKKLVSQRNKFYVLKVFLHSLPKHECCDKLYQQSVKGPHYHYLVQFDPAYLEQKKAKKTHLIGEGYKPQIWTDKMSVEMFLKYCDNYEEIETTQEDSLSDEEQEPIDIIEERLFEEAKKTSKRQSALDVIKKCTVAGCDVRDELRELFPRGIESFNELMSLYSYIPASATHIKTNWDKYVEYEIAHVIWSKYQPYNEMDENVIKRHPEACQEIKSALLAIHYKICKEKKVPIIFMAGVASSGKTFYQIVCANVLGTPMDYQDTQLTSDNLVMDTAVRTGKDIMCFEEFSFTNFKTHDQSKCLQSLKRFSTGRPMDYRIAKNTRKLLENKLKINGIFIATNDPASEIMTLTDTDDGIKERRLVLEFNTPIPQEKRWEQNYQHENLIHFIKYGIKFYQSLNE